MPRVTIQRSLRIGGIAIGGTAGSVDVDQHNVVDVTIPAGETAFRIDINVDVSDMEFIGIEASEDCTLKTNDPGTPTDTIELKARKALLYEAAVDPAGVNPLTADVTALYVATGSEDTRFQFGVAQDATP